MNSGIIRSWVGWFAMGFISMCGTAWADCTGTPEDCLKVLKGAYETFCQNAEPGSAACKAQQRAGVQWLRLDLYCKGDTTPPTRPGCADFQQARERLQPLVLAYNHASGVWQAEEKLDPERIKRDVGGKPTVSLAPNEDVIVVVENTNPLFYAVSRGVAAEAATPEVAQLLKLASLLGGGVQSLLVSLAEPDGKAQAGTGIGSYQTAIEDNVKDLQGKNARIACLGRQTMEQRARVVAFLQAIELDRPHSYPLTPTTCPEAPGAFTYEDQVAAFEALSTSLATGFGLDPGCPKSLAAALKAYSMDGTKPNDLRAAIREFQDTHLGEVCHPLIRTDVQQALQVIVAIGMEPDAELPGEISQESVRKRELETTVALTTRHKALLEVGANLLKERENAVKAVASIATFTDLLKSNVTSAPALCTAPLSGSCQEAQSVDRRLFLEPNAKPVQWDKIQTHPIQVKAVSPFASAVVASRPASVDTTFSLDSVQRGLWGIGASVIWTNLKSPTFSAITDPTDPAKTRMIIAETDQEVRAGGLALLVDYKLGRRLFPRSQIGRMFGFEFGAAADTSKPGFFGGLSLQLGKYVRLGGGKTYQRIKALRDQDLGDVVKATSDIKTRQRFEDSTYISLSIAIEPLRLFTVN